MTHSPREGSGSTTYILAPGKLKSYLLESKIKPMGMAEFGWCYGLRNWMSNLGCEDGSVASLYFENKFEFIFVWMQTYAQMCLRTTATEPLATWWRGDTRLPCGMPNGVPSSMPRLSRAISGRLGAPSSWATSSRRSVPYRGCMHSIPPTLHANLRWANCTFKCHYSPPPSLSKWDLEFLHVFVESKYRQFTSFGNGQQECIR